MKTDVEIQEHRYDYNLYVNNPAIKESEWSHDGYIRGIVVFHINNDIEPEKNGKIELEPAPLDDSFLTALGDGDSGSQLYNYNTLLVARDYIDSVLKKYEELKIDELKNKNINK